jgi:uncharacterized protein YdgA (DUF945 family)
MTIDEVISSVEEKIKTLEKEEIVKLWNWAFQGEETIEIKDLTSKIPGKEEELKEEITSIIFDQISGFNTKMLIKAYNKVMDEKITIEDIDNDFIEEDNEEEEY